MNCPTCKYPNPAGATHCGMCYEVFNRSAAQTYLHTVRRERQMTEQQKTSGASSLNAFFEQLGNLYRRVDWARFPREIVHIVTSYRQPLLYAIGIVVVGVAALLLTSSGVRLALYGARLEYSFPARSNPKYLINLHTEAKMWSERQARLDTPMESFQMDDIGNVELAKIKKPSEAHILLSATEWIEILHSEHDNYSRNIPLNHPSISPLHFVLDKHGSLLQRHYAPSPRLAKAANFILPGFPAGAQRPGKTWSEPVQWIEMYDDWKIFWAGDFVWTLDGQEPCGRGSCAHLIYEARVQPKLWAAPAWASGAVGRLHFDGTGHGEALFDDDHGLLWSNAFSYEGAFHIPIQDLGRIPWELRIGRRVRGPGELVLQFRNHIDINKP